MPAVTSLPAVGDIADLDNSHGESLTDDDINWMNAVVSEPDFVPVSDCTLPDALAKIVKTAEPIILHVCSGPEREGSYAEHATALGLRTIDVDICLDARLNLTHDECWNKVIADVDGGMYAGGQLDPQCSTFSAARGLRGGPAPLRGAEGRALYGLPDLSPEDRIRIPCWPSVAPSFAWRCVALVAPSC